MISRSYRWSTLTELLQEITELIYLAMILIEDGMVETVTKICMKQVTSKNISINSPKADKSPFFWTYMVTVVNYSVFSMATQTRQTPSNLVYFHFFVQN